MSLKEQILNADDLPREKINVPEWDCDVWIRSLTAKERDDYEQSLLNTSGTGKDFTATPNLSNAKAKFVARCLVDDTGLRVFTDAEAVPLGGKAAQVLNRLYEVASRLSGMSADDLEELVKNSEETQGEDLG